MKKPVPKKPARKAKKPLPPRKAKKPLPPRKVTKADHARVRKKIAAARKLKPRPFQLNWSTRDQTTAFAEGWAVILHPKRGLEIEKLDNPPARPLHRFETDAEAYWYVAFRAARGSGLHIRALDEVREHNFHRYPREIGHETGLPHPHEVPPLRDRPDADIYQTRTAGKRHKG
jgi:hypothetical protein